MAAIGFLVFGASCARAPSPPAAHANGGGFDLRRLAAEMDDRSAVPIRSMLPPDLEKRVAARIPASLSPAERRRLGEQWVSAPGTSESCDGRNPPEDFLSFVAGWALLEELAWSPTSDGQHVQAAAALYDRLRKDPFTSEFRWAMETSAKVLAKALGPRREKFERDVSGAFCLGPVTSLIAGHALALQRHFAAEILRGEPSDATARVLRDEAARRSEAREFRRAVPFAATAAQLLPRTSDAWLDCAKVSYQADDVARGDDALGRALALGADGQSEPVETALRFQAFAHAPPPQTFEQRLSRFWALFEMERLDEAMALAAGLRRDRPNDARAFLGDVWLKSVVRLGAGESVLDVAHASFLAFSQARNLTGRDADFDRVCLSLAFQDVTWSMISGVGSDRPMSEPAFVAAVARVRDLSKQLAATIPAEAAIYGLAADVLDTMRLAAERHAAVARALGEMFPRALAVYEAYPSADSYRLLLSLATVADDWKAASAAITAAPRLDARDADALALSRAQVFVSGAIRAKDWSRLQSLSTLLAVIPRSSDDADREVDLLRSDAEMVRAVHGETVLWTSACSGYSHISWTFPAWDRNRALSNAWAIHDLFQREGDDSDVWVRLRAGNQPDWPVLVNGAAAAFRAGRRDEAAAILKSRTLKVDEHRPDFVVEWLACLEGTPPKPAGPPQAADGNPLVEIVAEGARTSDAATWQVSAALGRPPAHPTLQFILGVQSPWLIASPRACRASEAPQRPDGDR